MFGALRSVQRSILPYLQRSQALHRYTADNNEDTPFDFTKENYAKIETILSRYPTNYKSSGIMPLLDMAQRQCNNFLPLAAMDKVAKITGVSPMQVYELCGTTPCMVNGSEDVKGAIEEYLGIKEGDTTKDGQFTLLEVECLGSCTNAPMENLSRESIVGVLKICQETGKVPKLTKWGSLPLNGQLSCEGPLGSTTLKEISEPFCRELPPKKVDPASIKKAMYPNL